MIGGRLEVAWVVLIIYYYQTLPVLIPWSLTAVLRFHSSCPVCIYLCGASNASMTHIAQLILCLIICFISGTTTPELRAAAAVNAMLTFQQ